MRGKALTDPCIALCHGITPACAGKRPLPSFPVLSLWDHPRVCGEKGTTEMCKLHKQGSPPRVRGKVFAFAHVNVYERITPAYAGKSRSQPRTAPRHRDHPRVCGEKMSRPPAKTRTPGLPPRMRGKEVKALLHFNWVGITPAYAGKSSPGSAAGCHARDHPRVCGEKGYPATG